MTDWSGTPSSGCSSSVIYALDKSQQGGPNWPFMWRRPFTSALFASCVLGIGYFMEPLFPLGDWRWLVISGLSVVGIILLHAGDIWQLVRNGLFSPEFLAEWKKQSLEDRRTWKSILFTIEGRVMVFRRVVFFLLFLVGGMLVLSLLISLLENSGTE